MQDLREDGMGQVEWDTGLRWIGARFPQDDGTHRWEDLRQPEEYQIAPWIRHLFRQSQSLRPQAVKVSTSSVPMLRLVQDRVDPNVELHPFNIMPPRVAEIGQPFHCKTCGAVTWVPEGKYLKCKPCNARYQQKWRGGHQEESRALAKARYRAGKEKSPESDFLQE